MNDKPEEKDSKKDRKPPPRKQPAGRKDRRGNKGALELLALCDRVAATVQPGKYQARKDSE